MSSVITPFAGGIAIDDRGQVSYSNSLGSEPFAVRRFYIVSNHRAGFIRAWHAHKAERKLIWPLSGALILAAFRVDLDTQKTEGGLERVVLSAAAPKLLHIDAGCAHGWKGLTPNASILVLSDRTLEESVADDFRLAKEAFFPTVWSVIER